MYTHVRMPDVNVWLTLGHFGDLVTDIEDIPELILNPKTAPAQDVASLRLLRRYVIGEETIPLTTSVQILRTVEHKLMHPSRDRVTGELSYPALTKNEAQQVIRVIIALVRRSGVVVSADEVAGSMEWAKRTLPADHEDTSVLASARAVQQRLNVDAWVQLVTGDGDFTAYRKDLLAQHVRAVRPGDLA